MRQIVDRALITSFMAEVAAVATARTRLYFTGGATALLMGWRDSTIDVDIKLVPDTGAPMKALPRLKESLSINIELAAPVDFIPVPAGWEDRSPFIQQIGAMSFHHFEMVAQAMAKIERGHTTDRQDVVTMLARGLVMPAQLIEFFSSIEAEFYRYPAIDPPSLRRAVLAAVGSPEGDPEPGGY